MNEGEMPFSKRRCNSVKSKAIQAQEEAKRVLAGIFLKFSTLDIRKLKTDLVSG